MLPRQDNYHVLHTAPKGPDHMLTAGCFVNGTNLQSSGQALVNKRAEGRAEILPSISIYMRA